MAAITGGNAFNGVIDNHIWAGGTCNRRIFPKLGASLLSGAGDYEWVDSVTVISDGT